MLGFTQYYRQSYYFSHGVSEFLCNPVTLIIVILLLFFISLVITLEIQQRRLKTPIAELSESQKSKHPQWIFGLITFIVLFLIGSVYFLVGKYSQSVPEIPASYFDRPRRNENLFAEENGYEQIKKLIGTTTTPLSKEEMEKYPFVYREKGKGERELGSDIILSRGDNLNLLDPEYLTSSIKVLWDYNRFNSQNLYDSYTELVAEHPDALNIEKLQILEDSDFFPRIEEYLAMEWRKDDFLPVLQGIQSLERVLQRLMVYHADIGELEKAVQLNVLALQLGEKYLSSCNSLIDGLIGVVNLNIPMLATQYLLEHHQLSAEQKSTLLETYTHLLTTDSLTVYQNIFKAEYHTMLNFFLNFEFDDLDQVSQIGVENYYNQLPGASSILMNKPFYDIKETQKRYAYAMHELTEAITNGKNTAEISHEIRNQSWNLYNVLGDSTIEAILPRLEGTNNMLDQIYQQKDLIISQLEA
ncbi:MAG: hypothetical protein LBO09_07990 [Candidatus Peribacteria bacterium]|nr:hypothetical protein [Candidatus Peribacteria bacterium]